MREHHGSVADFDGHLTYGAFRYLLQPIAAAHASHSFACYQQITEIRGRAVKHA